MTYVGAHPLIVDFDSSVLVVSHLVATFCSVRQRSGPAEWGTLKMSEPLQARTRHSHRQHVPHTSTAQFEFQRHSCGIAMSSQGSIMMTHVCHARQQGNLNGLGHRSVDLRQVQWPLVCRRGHCAIPMPQRGVAVTGDWGGGSW